MAAAIIRQLRMAKSLLGKTKRKLNLKRRRLMPPSVPLEHVVIGIGAQKSGTTWLASTLAAHPDVYVRKKEVHYWDTVRAPYVQWDGVHRILVSRGNSAGSPFGNNPLDHSQYLQSLDYGRRNERILSEITPAYALCAQATFSQMKAVHRDVRFVFLMRDPVDRLWSGLRHKMRESLQQDDSEDWLNKMFLEACEDPHDPDFRRSCYDQTIRALDGADCHVCVMFYETLFTDESLSALAQFVGVDRLAGRFDTRINVGAGAELRLSEPARLYGRKALADTYEFVADRFGDFVPTQWMK